MTPRVFDPVLHFVSFHTLHEAIAQGFETGQTLVQLRVQVVPVVEVRA
jgi:hypothetical protein